METKEVKFTRCFINGKKCGILSLADGRAVLLNNQKEYNDEVLTAELRAIDGLSLRGFQWCWPLVSADAAGVRGLYGESVTIDWENSTEYQARVTAAVGTRSAGRGATTSGAAAGGGVASSDAFQVPGVDSVAGLVEVLRLLPAAIGDDVKAWGVSVGASAIEGTECPSVPESCTPFLVMPSFPPSLDAYKLTIQAAAKEYAAKVEEQKKAAEAAAAAAEAERRAKENGKNVLVLADGSTVEFSGVAHSELLPVLNLLSLRDEKGGRIVRAVYLHGPAGTGKSTLAAQVAEALGLPLYCCASVQMAYDITGFVDASGRVVDTAFSSAAINGGVCLGDELDAFDPVALTAVNGVLANGVISRLGGSEAIKIHKDFVFIGTGNTIGRGADSEYTGRNCLDAATLDRFAFRYCDYDEKIELKLAGGDSELVKFIHEIRRAAAACGVSLLATPRCLQGLASASFLAPVDALQTFLFKGLEVDQIKLLSGTLKGSSKWFDAVKELAA